MDNYCMLVLSETQLRSDEGQCISDAWIFLVSIPCMEKDLL